VRKLALVSLLAPTSGCFSDAPVVPADETGEASETNGSETSGDELDGVSLSGIVQSSMLSDYTPLAGVRVQVHGLSDATGITDEAGRFEIHGVPEGETVYLAASPSSEFVGTVVGVDVRFASIDDIEIIQLSKLQIAQQMMTLQEADPELEFDDSRGHVVLVSDTLGATATLDPLPDDADVYALDASGVPELGTSVFRFFPFPLVVFLNLELADPEKIRLGATHPTQACTVDFPTPPTLANHLTWLGVRCS
jgi:hypothetical protein